MSGRQLLLVVASALVLAGCVGPATTTAAYRGKAVHAAGAAVSELETVVLTSGAVLHGKIMQAYAETVVSEAEDALSSVQGSFDSIQPPDDTVSDQLRTVVDDLLTAGLGDLSELRIALRRGAGEQVAVLADALKQTSAKLSAFSESHS
jgi:hypothetical protein